MFSILKVLVYTSEEVNCTEACPTVRVLWFNPQGMGAKLDDGSKVR
jgi:hypothetical protein